jgi:hypothetical protein
MGNSYSSIRLYLPKIICPRLRTVSWTANEECVSLLDDAVSILNRKLGPNGWLYEEGKYHGLKVGTKVVCTNSFNIGHVGFVEAILDEGKVTYRFPTLPNASKIYEVWEAKSKWRFTVVPQDTSTLTRMSESQIRKYCEPHEALKRDTVSVNIGIFEAFLPSGELKRREDIKIRCAKEDERRKTEDTRRLKENKLGGDIETRQEWRTRREQENFERVLENGRRKTEQKQILEQNERTIHRSKRKKLLLWNLNNISCLVDVIFDLEDNIQLWYSPLGWVFEDGKYMGLRSGSRVVCTSKYIGHVGYVSSIVNDSNGTAEYYFPTYHRGKFSEVYGPTQAINSWRLCIVPDDTDLSKLMSPLEALSYLER